MLKILKNSFNSIVKTNKKRIKIVTESRQIRFQRRYADAQQIYEKVLNIAREIQVLGKYKLEITMRNHLIPVRMIIIIKKKKY